ncbi:hypothetical protein [Novipirellula artificiosorum]|uniref:Uncharacterized protein n=1 Tax=Novipirellula artificiosorum TaxID=2528016 RepID=A0A5C6DTU6_9BACT|nr:hypothetical protein [Novipirellula artificiosorum]TWU39317.1 hypothetical protein Poly41_21410 [Novipirellula artificiosorum]
MSLFISDDGIAVEQRPLDHEAYGGRLTGESTRWLTRGEYDIEPSQAVQAMVEYLKSQKLDPSKFDIQATQVAEKLCHVDVSIRSQLETPTSFSTTGGTTHLNQSLVTRGIFAAPGYATANYQGAIGVDDTSVQGVDITIPALQFQLRRQFKTVDVPYLNTLFRLTGCVNDSGWGQFSAGEVLFLGAEGGENEENNVDLTYQFACRPNQLNFNVGNILVVEKRGWDYLWVKHEEALVGDRILRVPAAAYVEQVYPTGDFDLLALGEGGL